MEEAKKIDVVAIKYQFQQSILFKNKADEADKNREWGAAQEYYKMFEDLHAKASHELNLFENAQWAVAHSEKMIQKYRRKRNYDKCSEMDHLRTVALNFLELVGESDIKFIQQRLAAKNPPPVVAAAITPATAAAAPVAAAAASTVSTATPPSIPSPQVETEPAVGFAAAPAAEGSRKRACQKYVGKANCTPTVLKKPPSIGKFNEFKKKTSYNAYVTEKGRKVVRIVNPSKEPYIISHGSLYCNACKKAIGWDNRGKHLTSTKHKENKVVKVANANATDEQRQLTQSRIREDQLQGREASDEKLDASLNFLKFLFGSNTATNAVVENRVRIQYTYIILCMLSIILRT